MSTMDHGTIMMPDGLLPSRLKFHLLKTQTMVASTLKTRISLELSTISKSVMFMTHGTKPTLKFLLTLVHKKASHSPPLLLKSYMSHLTSITQECILKVANTHTLKVPLKYGREQLNSVPPHSLTRLVTVQSVSLLLHQEPTQ